MPESPENREFQLCHREGKGWDLLPGVVTLDATGVGWTNEKENGRLDYSIVERIFLWVAVDGDSPATWKCGISGGGRQVSVGSAGSSCRTEGGEAQYREFVLALHERLLGCSQPIEFVTLPKVKASTIWLLLAGLAVFVVLVILIPQVTGIAGDSLALWIPLLAALLVYGIALGFRKREQQSYPPDDIPGRLLP